MATVNRGDLRDRERFCERDNRCVGAAETGFTKICVLADEVFHTCYIALDELGQNQFAGSEGFEKVRFELRATSTGQEVADFGDDKETSSGPRGSSQRASHSRGHRGPARQRACVNGEMLCDGHGDAGHH